MAGKKSFARKSYFVDRQVQGALVRRLLLQWLLFLAILIVVLPCWEIILSGDFLTPTADAMRQSWTHTVPVYIFLLALLPAFAWDTVKITNRFVGPILRLRRAMRAAANGEEVEPVKFRDGDFWSEFADDFNSLLDRIRRAESTADGQTLPTPAFELGEEEAQLCEQS